LQGDGTEDGKNGGGGHKSPGGGRNRGWDLGKEKGISLKELALFQDEMSATVKQFPR